MTQERKPKHTRLIAFIVALIALNVLFFGIAQLMR